MSDEITEIPKKIKKTYVKKTPVKELAEEILKDDEDEVSTIENEDIPEIMEVPQEYEKIPKKEEKPPAPTPVQFKHGQFKDDAFVINRRIEEMHAILEQHFGKENGSYFIINENTSTRYKNNQRKRYKCMLVEDKNGFRYGLWFDLTAIGAVY